MKKILTSRWPGLVLAAAGILMMGYGLTRLQKLDSVMILYLTRISSTIRRR